MRKIRLQHSYVRPNLKRILARGPENTNYSRLIAALYLRRNAAFLNPDCQIQKSARPPYCYFAWILPQGREEPAHSISSRASMCVYCSWPRAAPVVFYALLLLVFSVVRITVGANPVWKPPCYHHRGLSKVVGVGSYTSLRLVLGHIDADFCN